MSESRRNLQRMGGIAAHVVAGTYVIGFLGMIAYLLPRGFTVADYAAIADVMLAVVAISSIVAELTFTAWLLLAGRRASAVTNVEISEAVAVDGGAVASGTIRPRIHHERSGQGDRSVSISRCSYARPRRGCTGTCAWWIDGGLHRA